MQIRSSSEGSISNRRRISAGNTSNHSQSTLSRNRNERSNIRWTDEKLLHMIITINEMKYVTYAKDWIRWSGLSKASSHRYRRSNSTFALKTVERSRETRRRTDIFRYSTRYHDIIRRVKPTPEWRRITCSPVFLSHLRSSGSHVTPQRERRDDLIELIERSSGRIMPPWSQAARIGKTVSKVFVQFPAHVWATARIIGFHRAGFRHASAATGIMDPPPSSPTSVRSF